MNYRECAYCGASLDFGERCSCQDKIDEIGEEKLFEELRARREAETLRQIKELPEFARKFARLGGIEC